jgi:ATP-binding cassette subfamily F protein 3
MEIESFDLSKILKILTAHLNGIDDDALDYFSSMLSEEGIDGESVKEGFMPFLDSWTNCDATVRQEIVAKLRDAGVVRRNGASENDEPRVLENIVVLNKQIDNAMTDKEREMQEGLWGIDKVRDKRNEQFQGTEAGSAKYERKAKQEQKKWLNDLEQQFSKSQLEAEAGEDDAQISAMMLPDLSGNSREKDIQVTKVNITFGGHLLLDDAEIRISYGHRYGLCGRNGVGKTTLLRHMAAFDIKDFPRHHRILHVKQEVKSSALPVIEVVLAADVERTELVAKEKALLARQEAIESKQSQSSSSNGVSGTSDLNVSNSSSPLPGASAQPSSSGDGGGDEMLALQEELAAVYERMEHIGVYTAESRAASILSGLQFSEAMQAAPVDNLSGGWRMRVALAAALLLEPDLLMLDEPTNHLDLEAVLWLQRYLRSYKHTVLLVSHDRAFLNEVCTDMIYFNRKKLEYYKGNYDIFVGTRKEMLANQQRQHEAQAAKLAHMQEFVDKFRFNAKRASLVQSRIKAIEREKVIDAVENETDGFRFFFPDAGQLGRPIIQIEGVTFGYGEGGLAHPLFRDVHMSIDQDSRIALVGPNGAGKSTLLNLILGKLSPTEGFCRVNPNLRIGVFTQHHLDSMDLNKSAVQNMAARWPLAPEAELRSHLGKYELHGNDVMKPIKFVSGGQKSRVAFACLTFTKPHVLLLDEPTNHLDMEAINALTEAIKNFTGGALIISHDQYFINSVCDSVWVVGDQAVRKFRGSFDEYKVDALKNFSKSAKSR